MTNLETALAYYKAVNDKNVDEAGKFLHPHIQFQSPLSKVTGKEIMMEGLKNFFKVYNTLNVRVGFSSKDQVMLVIDLDCPAGVCPSAVLFTFADGLIAKSELIVDPRPFLPKQ